MPVIPKMCCPYYDVPLKIVVEFASGFFIVLSAFTANTRHGFIIFVQQHFAQFLVEFDGDSRIFLQEIAGVSLALPNFIAIVTVPGTGFQSVCTSRPDQPAHRRY